MDEKFKNGFLTPFGLIPMGKDFEKDYINFDRFMSHYFSNWNFIGSMFDWDGLPESLDERFMEYYLISNGSAAVVNPHDINPDFPDDIIVIRGSRAGDPKNYGLGNIYNGTNDNSDIGSIEGEVNKIMIVGYNNQSMTPDLDSWFYANTLKEIEKSILFNVRFARLAPILKASNGIKKEALEQLLNNIDDGNMVNIITANIVDEMLKDDSTNTYEPIHLTNVEDIKNLQYLIKAYEDLLRIFHTKYGQAENGTGKLAQQSVDEINGSASASFVLALDKLKQRQKWARAINAKFNLQISVKFSPAWELEYQRYINRADPDEVIEGSEDESELESEESSEPASEEEAKEGEEE